MTVVPALLVSLTWLRSHSHLLTAPPRQGFDISAVRFPRQARRHLYTRMAGNAMSVPVVGTILLAATRFIDYPMLVTIVGTVLQGFVVHSAFKSFPEAYYTPKAPKKRSSGINQGFGADAFRSLSTFGRLSELGFGLGPRAAAFFWRKFTKACNANTLFLGITQKSNDSTTYPFIKEQ